MRQNPHVRICGGPGSATTLVYPTDTYPQFVRPDLTRKDGNPLGEAMTTGHTFPAADVLRNKAEMPSRPAIQLSRLSNHRDPAGFETSLIKLFKVIKWMRSR